MKRIHIILSSVAFCMAFTSFAGIEPQLHNYISGATIANNASYTTYDNLFLDATGNPTAISPSNWHLYRAENAVTLRLDQTTIKDCQLPQFTATVDVTIETKDEFGNTGPTYTQTLIVNYDNALTVNYKERHTFTFKGAYWVKVTVTSPNPIANTQFLILESTIDLERYKDLDFAAVPAFNLGTYQSNDHLLTVSWNAIDGAEGYDLEWTWVDNIGEGTLPGNQLIAATDLEYSFVDDATRVTLEGVSSTTYTMSPSYEQGYLLFRVRAYGKAGAHFEHTINGTWSSSTHTPTGTVYYVLPNFFIDQDAYYLESTQSIAPHEEVFNWQYTITFAESGKKKEVISYFDGSLRNRQSVTRLNEEDKAVVGEQIYDHQGRPAINILPVPDMVSYNLDYRHDFNKADMTSRSYSREDFDKGGSLCSRSISALSNSSGAALYYSQNNPWVGSQHYEYIPDALGYPFTVTEYTPDNTGRIRRQSGVGFNHFLGSTHETKYFYGVPEQEELDRLFGNNVGYHGHYEKEMVIDPNGQVSVSYKDASGRVIATALAGDAPGNVTDLDNVPSPAAVTSDLMTHTELDAEGNHIMSKSIVVPINGDYTFDYSVDIPRYSDANLPGACADCVYELVISLVDECNVEQFDGDPGLAGKQPIIRTLGKPTANYDVSCESGPLTYSFNNDALLSGNITIPLTIGNYTLTKSIRIDEDALNYYSDHYMTNATGLLTEEDFIDDYLLEIDYSGCETTCEQCTTNLGTLQSYKDAMTLELQGEGFVVSQEDLDQMTEDYNLQLAQCNELCDGVNHCQVYLEAMMADVSPGGQYAEFTEGSSPTYDGLLSTDWSTNVLEFNYQYYEDSNGDKQAMNYNNGQPILVDFNDGSGTLYTPNQLTQEQFIYYFTDDMAEVLVTYHPEYCQYEFLCIDNPTSEDYDAAMLATQTYAEAESKGYLNPTNDPSITEFTAGDKDPIWVSLGPSLEAQINTVMGAYRSTDASKINCRKLTMWEMPLATYICSDLTACEDWIACVESYDWDDIQCKPYLDMMWQLFRASYLAEKRRIVQNEYLNDPDCDDPAFLSDYEERIPEVEDVETLRGSSNTRKDIESKLYADVSSQCSTTCEAQVDAWITKLQPCIDASTNWNDPADLDNLKDDLIDVCVDGCDSDNPFGSSSVAPSKETSQGPNSFKDVFDSYVTSGKFTQVDGVCDVNLIDFPMAYGHNYTGKDDYAACTILADSTDDCVLDETNADIRMALLETVDKDSSSCEKCIGCDEVYEAVEHLQSEYGGVFQDDTEGKQDVAVQVLNNYLGFNLEYEDYHSFVLKCLELDDTTELSSPLRYYYTQYNYIAFNQIVPPKGITPEEIKKLQIQLMAQAGQSSWDYSSIEEKYLLASSSDQMALYASPHPDSLVQLKPCMCNLLQQEWDNYITNGGDPGDINQFNTDVSNNCYEVGPGKPVFDFHALLQTCRDVYESDGSVLTPASTWNNIKKNAMYNLVLPNNLFLPDCFPCNDPSAEEHNPWHRTYKAPNGNGPGGSGPGTGTTFLDTLGHIMPCDSFMAFVDSMMQANPALAGIDQDIYNYSFQRTSFGLNLGTMNTLMTAFYNRFPNAYKDPYSRGLKGDIEAFLLFYVRCYSPEEATTYGCCYEDNSKARKLELFLDAMTATKGILGNHFVYDKWNMYSQFDEYYNSSLYGSQACSTSLKSHIRDNYMPTLHMSYVDSCGDSNRLILNYMHNYSTQWHNNLYYYGRIVDFYNLRPVSNKNCDTAIRYFLVDVDQLTWDGQVINATLSGYTPDWVLKDTCKTTDTLRLCDRSWFIQYEVENPCSTNLEAHATYQAKEAYQEYLQKVRDDFEQAYRAKCREVLLNETFTMSRDVDEYHYTLYYYDQAGNLVQTVPPKGVEVITNVVTLNTIKSNRFNNTGTYYPNHTLQTSYEYNSLNQLIEQSTPDGGTSEFWYDALGRMVISQNAEQITSDRFSYTLYDDLGRIEEVGQLVNTSLMDWNVAFDEASLSSFVSSSTAREEVTQTFYDTDIFSISHLSFSQGNLRNRVVAMTYEDTHDGNDNTYDQAVHYSYDIHGNVDQLVRENTILAAIGHDLKLIKYSYELVSGNVESVTYQPKQRDQFIHKYAYDADNRLIQAFTSQDGYHYDVDGEYYYYLHGPLMRTEVGEIKVQGIDYAYTLHGWIKGINSNTLMDSRDIGHDGQTGTVNEGVAKDIVGYSLGYYNGDYTSIGTSAGSILPVNHFLLSTTGSGFEGASPDLYNGNIKHMVTAIAPFMGTGIPQGMTYTYDQLNRIKSARAWNNADATNNAWLTGVTPLPDFATDYTYDAMGNILSLDRNGSSGTNIQMDQMSYNYYAGTNRLEYVTDSSKCSKLCR